MKHQTATRARKPLRFLVCLATLGTGALIAANLIPKEDPGTKPGGNETLTKPVYRLIAEDNARQKDVTPDTPTDTRKTEAPQAPDLKPVGIHFEQFKQAPVRRLVRHPKFGEIIEVTYEGGRKLYEFPDPIYDVATGRLVARPPAQK